MILCTGYRTRTLARANERDEHSFAAFRADAPTEELSCRSPYTCTANGINHKVHGGPDLACTGSGFEALLRLAYDSSSSTETSQSCEHIRSTCVEW